jgi:ERCC4-related helicase
MAPTRPLVTQQLKACLDIISIPANEVTYLEGTIAVDKREKLWKDHRVIFCTPQTAYNDLKGNRLNPSSIVCIIIDEAHKATGNFAYAMFMQELQTIQELWQQKQQKAAVRSSLSFRVLALSATPGTDLRKIQEVRVILSTLSFIYLLSSFFLLGNSESIHLSY